MKNCETCKHIDTSICNDCNDGHFWVDAHKSFDYVISAVMFGCGIGGVIAAVFTMYT
ncbi:MAG: hypothetical protein KZQ74_06635 [gamma proteobacterium symbiont of Bathyaustriella thionipta]|nr:hypothetical protein [gamma proteobacterium symbiont of Bathyaustriella thionipta]MCU7957849.1 hypothetical protein [gamma proteobacterium symbiont of Bathyaustriella thionipta]MCU7966859.1 hypothetical protein [gamma proteobacterium symbiont of Bathyaustriella thionipta]